MPSTAAWASSRRPSAAPGSRGEGSAWPPSGAALEAIDPALHELFAGKSPVGRRGDAGVPNEPVAGGRLVRTARLARDLLPAVVRRRGRRGVVARGRLASAGGRLYGVRNGVVAPRGRRDSVAGGGVVPLACLRRCSCERVEEVEELELLGREELRVHPPEGVDGEVGTRAQHVDAGDGQQYLRRCTFVAFAQPAVRVQRVVVSRVGREGARASPEGEQRGLSEAKGDGDHGGVRPEDRGNPDALDHPQQPDTSDRHRGDGEHAQQPDRRPQAPGDGEASPVPGVVRR